MLIYFFCDTSIDGVNIQYSISNGFPDISSIHLCNAVIVFCILCHAAVLGLYQIIRKLPKITEIYQCIFLYETISFFISSFSSSSLLTIHLFGIIILDWLELLVQTSVHDDWYSRCSLRLVGSWGRWLNDWQHLSQGIGTGLLMSLSPRNNWHDLCTKSSFATVQYLCN